MTFPPAGVNRLAQLTDVNVAAVVNGQSLVYNAASGLWLPGIPAISETILRSVTAYSDHLPPIADNGIDGGWRYSGTNALSQTTPDVANRVGVNRCTLSAVNQNGNLFCGAAGQAGGLIRGGGVITIGAMLRFPTLPLTAAVFVGLTDQSVPKDANTLNGIGIVYNGANAGGDFRGRASSGAVNTFDPMDDNGGAITPVAGIWYDLKVVISAAGTSADLYIDGVVKATINTGFPPIGTILQAMAPSLNAFGASNPVDIDASYLSYNLTAARL